MGSEQSTRRSNTHHIFVHEERPGNIRQDNNVERELDTAIERQRKLYETRIRHVEAEAAKAKQAAQAEITRANQAAEAKARAIAQAQAARAQAAQALQAQVAQAQALQAQATQAQVLQAQAAQVQAAHVQAARAQAVQAQAIQTGAAPILTSRPTSSIIWERDRTPYSLSANDIQQNSNTNSPRPNLYPNLNHHGSPSKSATVNTGNQPSGFKNNNQPKNPFINGRAGETENSFVFVNRTIPSAPQRDRSASRSRGKNNNGEDDDIRCPTCRNPYGSRIFQCSSGHSSCDNCKQRRAPCGKCNQLITDMRNITLEDYVAERKIRCPNSVDGCCLFIKNSEVESHLKECPFGVMTCPLHPRFKQCTWSGKVSQLSFHVKEVHPDFNQADVDTEMLLLNICTDQQSLHFITIGNFNFLFHVKVFAQERKICMAAQLIGTQVSATKWNFEVHVYNKREPRRKHQFSDICSSSSIPINDIFNESKCMNLPLPYALTFYNEGCLAYKFFIKKANEGYERSNFGDNKRGFNRGRGRGGYPKN